MLVRLIVQGFESSVNKEFQKKKLVNSKAIMENLMVIRVEVIAPEKPLLSKHLQK